MFPRVAIRKTSWTHARAQFVVATIEIVASVDCLIPRAGVQRIFNCRSSLIIGYHWEEEIITSTYHA